MGRWAQRRRGNGGGGPSVTLRQIDIATITDPLTGTLDYTGPVTAADFAGADFTSNPSGENPLIIAQGGASQLVLTFGASIAGDADLTFDGLVSGVTTPQTIGWS